MNKTEIRARVREVVDLDESDVSNALLDLYIKDGYDRIISMEQEWPFFQVSTSFDTVIDQRDYPIALIGDGNLREIKSLLNVTDSAERITLVSYDDAEEVWLGGNSSSGRIRYWSTWGSAVNLWPRPVAVYTVNVRGYRKPTAWYDYDSIEVDADERLHQAVVYYALSQLYQMQEDPDLSQLYRNSFMESAGMARDDIMRSPSSGPLILNGGIPVARELGPSLGATGWMR